MPTTRTAPGAAPARVNSDHGGFESKAEVSVRVRQGAHWFFWIVAAVSLNSVFTIMGSHIHRFTGFGVTAMIDDRLAQPSGISTAMQLIVSGWLAGGFLFLGCFAAEGRKWAFAVGMAAYAVDGALLVAAGDYLSAAFHACMWYAIYRGFAALGQPASSKPSDVASAAHAG